jgi:hypothetical protein
MQSRKLESTEKVFNAAKMFPLWRDEKSRKLLDCSAKKNDRQRKTLQLQIDFVVSAPCAAIKSFFSGLQIVGLYYKFNLFSKHLI